MKLSLLRLGVGLWVACLLFLFTTNTFAGTAASGDLLRQAYSTLEQADHDYKGHRRAAMRHIEAAAKIVGVSVRGDGKNKEAQAASDQQLRAAKQLLEQARGGLPKAAKKQVAEAIAQLNTALKIK